MMQFTLKETWEGDGTGGVAFTMPSGGIVFVSRWEDRGKPDRATPEDWADAQLILRALAAYSGQPTMTIHNPHPRSV